MRLRRIEALRYGALAGASLGDLADGLTLVQGPNEAGKSSYTSLVRHVLYGYPTLRDSEHGYHVPGEGRCARLVFEDGEARWVVERSEGAHGGAVSISALGGTDRPGLLAELVSGVSGATYRTVFAFGLDEMAAIERERSADDNVIARLHAAGAGLRVNPQEVRSAIEREAGELFKPSGRKQPVNERAAEVRALRSELRELRAEAEAFLADQERLRAMDDELDAARAARDAARERATELAVALERADERLGVIAAQDEVLPALGRERAQLIDEAAQLAVNEALLASGADVEVLLEDAAGHGRSLQALEDGEDTLSRARVREADSVAATGLGAEALEALGDTPNAAAAVEEAREDLQRLQLQCETRDEGVRRAAAIREQAEAERSRLLAPLGITGDADEAIAERLSALDALEALRGTAGGRQRVEIPALILLGSGLVAIVGGAVLRQWITVAVGVVIAVLGSIAAMRSRRAAAPGAGGDEREYLRMLGLDSTAGPLEVNRMRRLLDAAKAASAAVSAADRSLEEAKREATLGCDALETRRSLWGTWLSEHSLDISLTPSAAAVLLTLVREARNQRALADEAQHAYDKTVEQLEAFSARFGRLAGSLLGLTAPPARDQIPALALRLKEMLAEARDRAARREEIARAVASLDSRIAAESERGQRARQDLLDLLARFDLAEGGSHEDLRVLHALARQVEAEATAHHDSLAQARHQLEGRLENVARDSRIGDLHLAEAGVLERLASAVDRYMVLTAAAKLLGEAQARYQRERQPEVVKRAGSYFATMTDGRYTGLSMPLGEGRIEVFDAKAGVHTSDVLSRGTAEQLYLSIRLGLISQLGDIGSDLPVLMDDVLVNFDPERRAGAARAIAELAESRQVIFFTCHPQTAELFAEVAPDHLRLDIPRLPR